MARTILPRSFLPVLRNRPFWDVSSLLASEDFEELTHQPGLSVSEDNEKVYVEADLPGMKPEDIDLSFDNGILWIKAERRQQERDKERKFFSQSNSSFSYRVALPGQIDDKQPEAFYEDGILSISLQKTKKSQVKRIPVQKGKQKR